jgi:drug/metabolite transporter (DMT)-like permease
MPSAWEWPLLISIGLIGGCAQFAMTAAFRAAPIGLIAPFDYLALVFATGFGYLIWGDVPDLFLVVGAAIVVASGLYILHREVLLGRARPAEPEPHP